MAWQGKAYIEVKSWIWVYVEAEAPRPHVHSEQKAGQPRCPSNLHLPFHLPLASILYTYLIYNSSFTMGVTKQTLSNGNGVDYPKKGDNVEMHYTGCLYNSEPDNHHMGTK